MWWRASCPRRSNGVLCAISSHARCRAGIDNVWLLVHVCAHFYVRPHVNACNPICMYFTHAHNLLFMKQVLFISPFSCALFGATSQFLLLFSQKNAFSSPELLPRLPCCRQNVLPRRVFTMTAVFYLFIFSIMPPANLHMYMCRLDEKSLHT